ncbi:MAG: hypothetical protein R2851_06565 [Caldilineaceae bacterium]
MDKDLLIGIDVGTTGTKAIAAARTARCWPRPARSTPPPSPRQLGRAEPGRLAGRDLRRAAASLCRPRRRRSSVAAVAVSCQAPSLVAVDWNGAAAACAHLDGPAHRSRV